MNFNEKHPELRPGEMWFTNCSPEFFDQYVGYESKRMGMTAYDRHGNVISRKHPVFISIAEYIDANDDDDNDDNDDDNDDDGDDD